MKMNIRKLTTSAVCLALCMVLPLLTGQIQQIGNMLLPMHFPVIILGFLCGWQYALVVGFIAPILRFFLFGMPPIFPIGIGMAFELATYGLVVGILYQKLPKKPVNIYVTLISAMVAGRIVWGVVRLAIAAIFHMEFPMAAFISGAVLTAIPGIIAQIILIPIIVLALQKAGFVLTNKEYAYQ